MRLNTKLIELEQLKRGWTQSDLAKHTGLHRVTISNIYRRHTATMKTVNKLTEVLEIPMSKMWIYEDEGKVNE